MSLLWCCHIIVVDDAWLDLIGWLFQSDQACYTTKVSHFFMLEGLANFIFKNKIIKHKITQDCAL